MSGMDVMSRSQRTQRRTFVSVAFDMGFAALRQRRFYGAGAAGFGEVFRAEGRLLQRRQVPVLMLKADQLAHVGDQHAEHARFVLLFEQEFIHLGRAHAFDIGDIGA